MHGEDAALVEAEVEFSRSEMRDAANLIRRSPEEAALLRWANVHAVFNGVGLGLMMCGAIIISGPALVLGGLVLGGFLGSRIILARGLHSVVIEDGSGHIAADERGYSLTDPTGVVVWRPWTSITDVGYTDTLIVARCNGTTRAILPRRCFAAGDDLRLLDLMRLRTARPSRIIAGESNES